MIRSIAILSGQFYLLFLVLNTLLVILAYRRLPVEVRTLVFFLLASLAVDLSSRWLFHQKANNLFLLHIYTLLEWLAWSYFFLTLYRKNHWTKGSWPFFLVGGVSILLVLNTLFLEPINGFNSNAKSLVQMLLIGYSIYYFFRSFGKVDLKLPIPQSISFITFAVMLYYSGSLFIFMSSKILSAQGVAAKDQFGFWAINALLLVLLHGLIFTAICKLIFRKANSSFPS